MSTPPADGAGSGDTAFSVLRSLVTPYVPFTVYVVAYTLFGAALGAWTGTLNIINGLGVAAAIWFGLEGLHAIDLADEGVATRLNNSIANILGYVQVGLGSLLGVWLASRTTWWFLGLVAAGAFLGLAYNEEWFGGLLHDRDKLTGLANFGVSWGTVTFLAGYFVMYTALRPALALFALAVTIGAIRLNYLEGHGAIYRYEDVGIEHTREHKSTGDEARSACHTANVMMIPVWVLVAAGGWVLLVL